MSEVRLWEAGSEVLCTQVPPWAVDPEGIEHWVRLNFPVCLPDFDYTPPTSYTRITADPPDLNWYDCFCLSFSQIEKKGFTMLSCGSATGKHTGDAGETLYDSTKNWAPDKLKGTAIVNITQGIAGYVQNNGTSQLQATVNVDGTGGNIYWHSYPPDYYEMSLPQDISFDIKPADSEDCCSQSYNVEYDFVMPCLPQNMTAATKLWYRYVMNCTKSTGNPPVQLTQEECAQLWEDSYRGMCSQDTVKFWDTYKYLDSTIYSIGIGDAVTLVRPKSFVDRKMMQSYSGSVNLSVTKPRESVNVFLTTDHPTSNELSWDVSGESGYPKPVPFEVVGIYPEPGSVIPTTDLVGLVSVRFNSLDDIADLEVIAYFEDDTDTTFSLTSIARADDPGNNASNYRFYSLGPLPEFAVLGGSRTLVVKAYRRVDAYTLYSSTVSATYTRDNPSTVVFERIEPASGEYSSLAALVYACELNTDVTSVDLIGAPVDTHCERVPGTTKWYWPGSGTVAATSYFQVVKDGAVYSSESINVATGGTQPRTSVILGETLQRIPNVVTNVVSGELVQVHPRLMDKVSISSSTLVRSGKTDTETYYARYTGVYFDVLVFESSKFSYAVNKFFSVVHGAASVAGNIVTLASASGGESASGLAGRAIVLLNASSKELGRYTIVESSITLGGAWNITVSVSGDLPSATVAAKVEPNRSFPATVVTTSGNGAGHTGTTTESFTLSYDPSSSYPTHISVDVDNLYATHPIRSSNLLSSKLPTPELTVIGPEVESANIVPSPSGSDQIALKAVGTDMDAGVDGVFTGPLRIEADLTKPEVVGGTTRNFLLNVNVGSFTVSRRISAKYDTNASDDEIHFLYPYGLSGDFEFNVPNVPVHYWYYGNPITWYIQHSIAELYLNEAEIKCYNIPSLVEPRIQYVLEDGKHYLDLYINQSQIKWSDPFASEDSYVGKYLVLDYGDVPYRLLTIQSSEVCTIGDSSTRYLRLQVSLDPISGMGSWPKSVTQFMVVDTSLMDIGETQVTSKPTKVYARHKHNKRRDGGTTYYLVEEGLRAPDVGQPALQYIWNNVCADIPWLGSVENAKDSDEYLVQNTIVVEDDNHHIGLYVEASGVDPNEWKYKTLTLNHTSPVSETAGIYQIVSNEASALVSFPEPIGDRVVVLCRLNTSSISAALSGNNVYKAVIGVQDAFAQCMLSVAGFNGMSATYRIIHNTGITTVTGDTMTFTLDSRTYPNGIITDADHDSLYGAALEISGDITGATINGLEVSYDSRWSLPFFANAPMVVTWQLDNECDDFYLVREQTTQALADDNASYVDCGGECEFDVTISGQSFKCDFGMKVIGRSVNIPGCGGGGMFSEIYISCPWAKHIHCDRPTAPCNCVFVLSYLLVIPLGSVLL